MNKKLVEYFKKYELTFEKNYAYGKIKDYEVNIFYNMMDNVSPVKIYFSFFATDNDKLDMKTDIIYSNIKNLQYQFDWFGALFG